MLEWRGCLGFGFSRGLQKILRSTKGLQFNVLCGCCGVLTRRFHWRNVFLCGKAKNLNSSHVRASNTFSQRNVSKADGEEMSTEEDGGRWGIGLHVR